MELGWWGSFFLSEVGTVGVGEESEKAIADIELGVAEELGVGRGDEKSCDIEESVVGMGLEQVGEDLCLSFLIGREFGGDRGDPRGRCSWGTNPNRSL